MKKIIEKSKILLVTTSMLSFLVIVLLSCSEDAMNNLQEDSLEQLEVDDSTENNEEENPDTSVDDTAEDTSVDESNGNTDGKQEPCADKGSFVFSEQDGLVNVEFEDAAFSADWRLKSDSDDFSGSGYMVWEGEQYLNNPGNAKTTYTIKINNEGTYQFIWKSAVKMGTSGSDHNDTWLRFSDADDFYARKDASIVYPKDVGKTPNPEGASKDGWFKIYRSGNDLGFKWQAFTFDNNPHEIFVVFDKPGEYTMEVSARSSGHGIDKFVLFKDRSKAAAISESNTLSAISCN